MALTAPPVNMGSRQDYKPVPAGSHIATLFAVLDIGTHLKRSQKYGDKHKRQIMLRWELPDELIEVEFEGVKEMRPMVVSKTMTFSMHENSELRPFIEGLTAKALTDKEAAEFDFEALAGTPCQINISHRDGTGRDGKPKTFADVLSMSTLPKRTTAPEMVNEPLVYSVTDGPPPETFPKWLREMILQAEEFRGQGQDGGQPQQAAPESAPAATSPPRSGPAPGSGRALFAWIREREQEGAGNLLKYINNWGKLQEFPSRIVDWDAEQVAAGYEEASRKLKADAGGFEEPGLGDDDDDDLPEFLRKA